MTETAPRLAGTLAEIGQIAAFEGLEEAGERFLEMLVEMLFQMLALQLVMAGLGIFGVGAPVMPSGFMHFGGPRQRGGPVQRGDAYLVGEAGPELFVPSSAGTVVPGSRASGSSGGGTNISVNVINNAPNAQVSTQQDEESGRIDILVDELVAGNLRPGTATSRAMRDRFGLNFQTRRGG
jgi:phage-related minor tail protein